MMLAYFTQVDQRELVEHGSGFFDILILAAVIFVASLPFCALWALLRRRSLKTAVGSAGSFTTRSVMLIVTVLAVLPLLAVIILVPFCILNMIGAAVFGRECYWPLIAPGMVVVFILGGAVIWPGIRSERQRKKHHEQKPVA